MVESCPELTFPGRMKMKKRLLLLFIAIFLSGSGLAYGKTPDCEDSLAARFTYGFESDLASRYLWRGLAFSDGPVSQNSLWMSKGNFTGSIWSNYNISDPADRSRFNELDYSLSFEPSFNEFTVSALLQAYSYPDQQESPSTAEISLGISYDRFVLNPFTNHTFDIKEYRGSYFGELGLRSSRDLNERISLEASVEIGWGSAKFNKAYINGNNWSLEVVTFEAASTWNFNDTFYIRPHLTTTAIIDRKIKALVEDPVLYQVGIALGAAF
jgi:hypothetical protein